MKKLITLTLCGMSIISLNAQKANVEQAKKLAGKVDKIEEARSLIKEAIANPETADQAETYYIAGKVEWDAFDKQQAAQMVNPDNVDNYRMGENLVNGFNYFVKVFPLDQVPNEKGEVKPKYTKELKNKISKKFDDFYMAGASLLDAKEHYPMAYQAFMIYGDMPELMLLDDKRPIVTDTVKSRANAYYYAGRAAFGAGEIENAILAFQKARQQGFVSYDQDTPSSHLYEIACWQEIEKNDTTRLKEAHEKILEVAQDGYRVYGVNQPFFLNNIVDCLSYLDRGEEALPILNQVIAENPDKSAPLSIRAWLYDSLGNNDAALADYLAAVDLPDVNYDTMRSAIRRLILSGQAKLNEVELNDPDFRAKQNNIKQTYIHKAKDLVEKAQTMTDDPSDLEYFIENINYLLGE